MVKEKSGTREAPAPPIMFKRTVPTVTAEPGDLVSYLTKTGYRLGDVVATKKRPKGTVPVRLRKGERRGPVEFVPYDRILHTYRDIEIDEPEELLTEET